MCPESSLQEFLEELDALCAPEVENVNPETGIENTKPRASEDSYITTRVKTPDGPAEQNGCVSTETALKDTEKRVRFSENLGTETPSQVKNGPVDEDRRTLVQDDSECIPEETKLASPEPENQAEKLNPQTEAGESLCPKAADVCISAEPEEKQPVEQSKSCSNRGNGTRTSVTGSIERSGRVTEE